MELASQECCLHRILFTRRYVTFVLVIITFVFILYSVVVLEKNQTRSTILTDRLAGRMLLCQRIFIVCASFKRYIIRLTHTYVCVCVDINS